MFADANRVFGGVSDAPLRQAIAPQIAKLDKLIATRPQAMAKLASGNRVPLQVAAMVAAARMNWKLPAAPLRQSLQ